MQLLVEHHVGSPYTNALESMSGITVQRCQDVFPPRTPDGEIAEFAENRDWVIFTRDDDFFKLAQSYDCGLIFMHQKHDLSPGQVADAIERIGQLHSDPSGIETSLPGQWI